MSTQDTCFYLLDVDSGQQCGKPAVYLLEEEFGMCDEHAAQLGLCPAEPS